MEEYDENIVDIKRREDTKKLKRDKENNIVLSKSQYDIVTEETGQYASAHAWIELKNTHTQCLIKNFVYNSTMGAYDIFIKNNGKSGIKICKYNNLIVPYIGSEVFGVDTVKYFFAKFSRGAQKIPTNPKIEYLVTLDEKMQGEEVWEGVNILMSLNSKDTLLFSDRIKEITNFLKLRKIPAHRIQEITDEFIRQEIFKKSIEYVDNHNVNWSLGLNEKRVRLFPAYDFDFCSGIVAKTRKETICDNGLTDLKSLIIQYKELPWMKKYIKEIVQNYNIKRVFEKAEEKMMVKIPQDVKQYFEEFYASKKKEMEIIYLDIFREPKKGDEEICI